jgi:hypothetical protein
MELMDNAIEVRTLFYPLQYLAACRRVVRILFAFNISAVLTPAA